MDGLAARLLPPSKRDALPEWEVIDDAGKLVGFISEEHIGRHGRQIFFKAIAIHPTTGERVNLELSADFANRLRDIADFRADPESSIHFRRWGR